MKYVMKWLTMCSVAKQGLCTNSIIWGWALDCETVHWASDLATHDGIHSQMKQGLLDVMLRNTCKISLGNLPISG